MHGERDVIEKKTTWELVEKENDKEVIGVKCVYNVKYSPKEQCKTCCKWLCTRNMILIIRALISLIAQKERKFIN